MFGLPILFDGLAIVADEASVNLVVHYSFPDAETAQEMLGYFQEWIELALEERGYSCDVVTATEVYNG